MALGIGVVLALAVGLMTRVFRLDRDRALYPTMMIVIAAYYVLFAVMGGSTRAVALAAHGVFDFVHVKAIDNPGVPSFWPPFCLAYDVTAAGFLAWLLKSGRLRVTPDRLG